MEAKNDIIVALEFGTSSIRGIAGRKRQDGSVQILGLEKEDALDSIQKGVITITRRERGHHGRPIG